MDTFKLGLLVDGPDSDHWDNLGTIMDDPLFAPDWEFDRYSGIVDLDDGTTKGVGLPVATWHLNIIKEEDRAQFRDYCPETQTSAEVYVMTPTNELDDSGDMVWIAAQAVMRWVTRREDKDKDVVIGFDLEFSMMVEVEEV